MTKHNLKVAVCGSGAVGLPAAKRLDHDVDGLDLPAASAWGTELLKRQTSEYHNPPQVLTNEESTQPGINRNAHTDLLEVPWTRLEISTVNAALEGNPVTGRLTPPTVIETLERVGEL